MGMFEEIKLINWNWWIQVMIVISRRLTYTTSFCAFVLVIKLYLGSDIF
jgi:hypothetical protein